MALTKNDLQQIGNVIDEKLQKRLSPIETDLKDVKKRVKKIELNVESMLGFLDEQDVKLERKVAKIEKHLNLPQT